MARRKKQRRPRRLTLIGAALLAFVLGMGSAWWVTRGETTAVADGQVGAMPAPTPTATPNSSLDPSVPGGLEGLSEEEDEIEFPPPLPPEDNPLNSALLKEDDIIKTGSGKFVIAPGSTEPTGPGGSNLRKYRVEVEEGLPFDADYVAEFVDEVLADERGWAGDNKHQFQRVDDDSFNFRILVATPDTVDKLCAPLKTNGKVSCGRNNRATLNALRWGTGVDSYGRDLENYRRYLINHEVGHLLGYPHENCPGPGQAAPVMVQQTLSTQGCEPNPWPRPKLAD